MSEIEKIKLYQNTGIEPTYTDECIIANRYWENEELANEYGTFDKFMKKNCKFGYQDCTDECEYAYTKTHYPPFTAEKQLKLVEFFISSVWWLNLKSLDKTLDYSLNFENKLAKLVNRLWQEFTKEQQQQVKGILE